MLRSVKDLRGFEVQATDGTVGKIVDLYFDDCTWTVRWAVVLCEESGPPRNVLLSPISLGAFDRERRLFSASLTRDQVRRSPDVDTQKPVSRQHEVEQYGYYGYPYYWGGSGLWGDGMQPSMMLSAYSGSVPREVARREKEFVATQAEFHHQQGDDPHLRSCLAIERYHLQASDGNVGHVQDVLIDEASWAIRYLVVETSDWWFGHQVLVSPQWIDDISWLEATVSVDVSRQAVKDAPPFERNVLPDRPHEIALHTHHDRPGYWNDADARDTDISRV